MHKKYNARAIDVLFLVLVTLTPGAPSPQADARQRCAPGIGQLVSLQGTAEIRGSGEAGWRMATLDEPLCGGDRVRTLPRSRATVLLRQSQTTLQLDQNTTITLPETAPSGPSWLELLKGAGHFLSRTPSAFKIRTPFVNAYIEGTEFVVRIEGNQTTISVFNGTVLASNDAGSLRLENGQTATAKENQAPAPQLVARPRDAVQWALYYPPIVDYRTAVTDGGANAQSIQDALDLYRQGRLLDAFARLDRVPANLRDARYFDIRAGLLLSVGRVDEARPDIEQALRLNPSDGTAMALQSIIAVVQNEKEQALSLARQAVSAEPRSPVPHIALSYAYQSRFDIDKAFDSVRDAVRLAPDNAIARARLAELSLSRGELDEALAAAKKAVALEPGLARTQTVLGFAQLTEINIAEAKSAFGKAIVLDPADPLPRLGLGLAKIRKGDLDEGTQDMEIAATLDPNNALVRSYLGKAYYEQKRSGVASTEFENAKALDPKDPTPWFYDAIRKQTENRPVEALHDLQKSIELNDNRAVYRSRLLLDQDVAARSVNLARIYDDLGFEQRARLEAWRSVNTDPTSFSAHRFLADSYARLPRYEIARVSELLQSQLLQPLNVTPIPAALAETNLAILEGAGPSQPSYNEFSPLFTRNNVALQADALFGNNGTVSDDLVLSSIQGPWSGSFGQFHYSTNGFRRNNDITHNIYNLFGQAALAPDSNIQVELRKRETEAGDTFLKLRGDPDFAFRETIDQQSARLGVHFKLNSRQDMLGSYIYENRVTKPNLRENVLFNEDRDSAHHFEIQHQYASTFFKTIAGFGYVTQDGANPQVDIIPEDITEFGRPLISNLQLDKTLEHVNGYLYMPVTISPRAVATFGVSYDYFTRKLDFANLIPGDDPIIPELLEPRSKEKVSTHRFNPKFGLLWNITDSTTLRLAAFRVLKRSILSNQTIEPSQLAGFNQFFDDSNGSISSRFGVGIDQRLSSTLYGGLEFSWRDVGRIKQLRNPIRLIPEPQDEQAHRAYLYWAPSEKLSLGIEYQFEQIDRKKHVVTQDLDRLTTHFVPFKMNYNHSSGLFAKLGATFVYQEGKYENSRGARSYETDKFWLLDGSIGYRLPKRYGLISLNVKNLLDEDFRFQTSLNPDEPRIPQFVPDRTVFARLNLWFY